MSTQIPAGERWPIVLVATLLLAALAPCGCASVPRRDQAPRTAPGPQSAQAPAGLVGQWVGQTEEDGTLTLVLGANGRVSYRFSGGNKEHADGRYAVRGNTLVLTEDGDDGDEAETWTFSLVQNQLHLRMPNDDEEYVLSKRN